MFLEREILNLDIVCWSRSLTKRRLPSQCTKSVEVYANKAQKIVFCISLHLQVDQ